MSTHTRPPDPHVRAAGRRTWTRLILAGVIGLSAAGCATFADAPPSFSPQPSLTPNIATVIPPGAGAVGDPLQTPASGRPTTGSPAQPGDADSTTDPCAPQPLPVVAVCLDSPWGLAPLPTGQSAIVGERVTGRILAVTAGARPAELATIADIDARYNGGLLGIALSPYYTEDQLIYAYVTTRTDARIIRFAVGQTPKAIVTGLPVGGTLPGGSIAFDASGLLYVATGSAPAGRTSGAEDATAAPKPSAGSAPGEPTSAAPPTGKPPPAGAAPFGDAALASSVLRFDTSGRPASQNSSGTALFASGFTDISGMCLLPTGDVGVVDHRAVGDLLLTLTDGADNTQPSSAATLWTYRPGGGGALDCAVADGALLATSRTEPALSRIGMRAQGGFTGAPSAVLDNEFGLLRTLTVGPGDVAWLTTANGAAARHADNRDTLPGKADPSDDRVIILPPSGGGGGDGGID